MHTIWNTPQRNQACSLGP